MKLKQWFRFKNRKTHQLRAVHLGVSGLFFFGIEGGSAQGLSL
jgi:hypothetical protein